MVSDKTIDAAMDVVKTFCEIVFDNQKNQLLKLREDVKLCKDKHEKKYLKELLVKKESEFKRLEKSYIIFKRYVD